MTNAGLCKCWATSNLVLSRHQGQNCASVTHQTLLHLSGLGNNFVA